MDNEMLYREFWLIATKDKLVELSKDLVDDARVEDFNKMESDICKSDAKAFISFIDWALPMIEPLIPVSDTSGQNRIRMMKVMRSKLQRRLTNN